MAAVDTFGERVARYADEQWVELASLFELAAMGLLPTSEAFAEVLACGDYAAACDEVAASLGLANPAATDKLAGYVGMSTDDAFHELRRERTRLFVGERTPLISPYAGVRTAQEQGKRGLLMVGEESMAIERFMRACGMAKDLSAGQSNDPVDHVGTLCEFMQYLCLVSARAVAVPEGAHAGKAEAAEFHEQHFAPYAAWCAQQLRAEARTSYYQFLPALLECLL